MDETLLLVDDEAGIRTVLSITLADMGFTVHTASSGREALEAFRTHAPDIVLTDINMPDINGIELLRRIKKENQDAEVIMFTGQGDMDLAIQSLKNEATDFVTKPIDDEVLEISIRRARERISLRRQVREYTENLERMVEEKAAQLIEAERMAAIGQTIAGLSHTIKNIAGGLKGGMFVLSKGIELDEKEFLQQGWTMVKGNVDKIRELSMDLLNYGKFADIHPGLNDPNIPPREVIAFYLDRAKEANIDIGFDPARKAQPFYFDSEAIYQSLLNLVSNAMDACSDENAPAGAKRVMVKATAADGWGIVYTVSDNGIGMNPAVQKDIFKSFFSTKGTHGTGIGLMMTQKIIDQHGGEIAVNSIPGSGTTVTLKLPPRPAPGQSK